MRGWISIVAVSAVLSAGLIAGRAAADSVASPAGSPVAASPTAAWSDPPARAAVAAPVKAASKTVPACTANAWGPLPSGCDAQGRPVRVIALSQR